MYPEQPNTPAAKPKNFYIPFIVAAVTAVLFMALFIWMVISRSSLARSQDALIEAAVADAETVLTAELTEQYDKEAKSDTKTIRMGETLGQVSIEVPKTWGAYLKNHEDGSKPVEFYSHPSFVPAVSRDISYAFRIQIEAKGYADVLKGYDDEIEDGELKSRVYKTNGATGVRLTGLVDKEKTGVLILLPLRDKTLAVWTEATRHVKDFETIIQTLTFTP